METNQTYVNDSEEMKESKVEIDADDYVIQSYESEMSNDKAGQI